VAVWFYYLAMPETYREKDFFQKLVCKLLKTRRQKMALPKSKYATGSAIPRKSTPIPAKTAVKNDARRKALVRIRELLPSIKERQDERAMIEKLLKGEQEELKKLMVDFNIDKTSHEGVRATKFTSSSPRINKTKLLQNNVSIDVIEKCTDLNPYETVRVTEIKEGEDE
jgi:hypothetical protein